MFRFKLYTKQTEFAIPSTTFEVKTATTSEDLSLLVNETLKETKENWIEREFNFLLCGQILCATINEHFEFLVNVGTGEILNFEKEYTIEYFLKEIAPEAFSSLLNDDWVSCVNGNENLFINGCYDGVVNLWRHDGKHIISIPAHAAPVKDIRLIKHSNESGDGSVDENVTQFITASADETCILWKFNSKTKEVDCISLFKGHERSVDCLDVHRDLFASGSFDNMLKIWSLVHDDGEEKGDDDDENKNSGGDKKKSDDDTENKSKKTRTPLMTLSGHTEAVTDVTWITSSENENSEIELASCSLDNTIKIWDVELGEVKQVLVGSKAFQMIDYSPLNHLLITGSCDRHVRLWDPRSANGTQVKMAFTSHSGWVSSVAWSTNKEHLFVSGSYDNYVKQWDIRSPNAPLYDLYGHEDKVLAVDWSNAAYILSGSADNHMNVFSCQS